MVKLELKLDPKSDKLLRRFPRVVQPASEELARVVTRRMRSRVEKDAKAYVGGSKLRMRKIKGGQTIRVPLYVLVQDQGRTPGARQPPTEPIAAWLRRKGLDPDNAFVYARSIGIRGIEGKFFFREAAEDVLEEENIPRIFGNIVRRKMREF